MAGCPYTRGFVEGPLVEVMKTVPELVDLEFTPFGNSYYPTRACGGSAEGMPYASYNEGYDGDQRECWDKFCGLGAVERPVDCFTGELICQHGTTDGMVTSAWACAKLLSQNSPRLYIPFLQCTSIGYLGVTSAEKYRELVATCAPETGFDAEDVLSCAATYDKLNAQGMLTPTHPGVPYALVDGEVLDDTACVACGDGIINKVCEKNRAKGGPSTPVCDAILR